MALFIAIGAVGETRLTEQDVVVDDRVLQQKRRARSTTTRAHFQQDERELHVTGENTVATATTAVPTMADTKYVYTAQGTVSMNGNNNVTLSSPNSLSSKRPNVLVITSDQLRYDAVSFMQNDMAQYRNKVKISTPNLDRLAKMGVHFRNAYTECPSCACARTSLRSGNTIERTGVQTNTLVSPKVYSRMKIFEEKIKKVETYDQVLVERLGYRSESYGKFHMPTLFYYGFLNKNRNVISSDDYDFYKSSFMLTPKEAFQKKYKVALKELIQIDNIHETFASGQQADPTNGFPYTPIRLDSRYGKPTNSPGKGAMTGDDAGSSDIGRGTIAANFTKTGVANQFSTRALTRLLATKQPFVLTASFDFPHPPQIATPDLFDLYWRKRKGLSASPSVRDKMLNTQYLYDPKRERLLSSGLGYNNPSRIREWMVAYYGCVQQIDSHVGQMMDILEKSGQANNTLIIFTADHGEMLGAHAMRGKAVLYEEATRVPLIMVYPGKIKPRTVIDTPVSHIDIFSTILDYVGASQLDQSDGLSLRRYIDGTSINLNYDESVVVSELDQRNPMPGGKLSGQLGSAPNFLIRKGDYKLIITKLASSKSIDMMYDLKKDPYEMSNLIGKRGATASPQVIGKAEHLKALLVEWMQRNNGGKNRYYSNPKYNGNEGRGDIIEISDRRTWRLVTYWQSDETLYFGPPALVGGKYMRYEYLYIGRTSPGVLKIKRFSIGGKDKLKFSVVGPQKAKIKSGAYIRVKIAFSSLHALQMGSVSAYIKIYNSENKVSIVKIRGNPKI